jgi:hypothetical protein
VGVHIDKAWGDDLARDVDLARALRPGDDTYSSDAVAGDGNIAASARPAAAVKHLAAPQNPIGHFLSLQ